MSSEKRTGRTIHLLVGPALFAACLLLGNRLFPSLAARAAVGTVAWMSYWWVTGPIDSAVTAFLPILINALCPMVPMGSVLSHYASETIMLLLGASILSVSWELTGLDKRLAMRFLCLIGPSVKQQLAFWFLLSALFSAVLPNAVVCATLTPIAYSMLKHVGEGDIANSHTGSMVLMTIAWGAGVGGVATPLGGAMNLIAVDALEKLTGTEFLYAGWVVRMLPFVIALVASNLLYLLLLKQPQKALSGSRTYFLERYRALPPMERSELTSLLLFLAATALAFTRQLYAAALPGLKPAYVFLGCAMLSFSLKDGRGERVMRWKQAEKRIVWDLLYLFAGGLAAGALINDSGAASAIAQLIASLNLSGGFALVLVITLITIVLSDMTSNTATAAVCVPIVISICQGLGLNPIPYVYVAAVGFNLSYTLPTSIRAIPVGYGMKPGFMFSRGLALTLVVIALVTGVGYALLRFWPAFSTP